MARNSEEKFSWKEFLLEILAWWRGNTWGTRFWIRNQGVYVGSDEFGNRYYRSKTAEGPNGRERRMVTYAGGAAEASRIPPGWHGWMHYRTDTPPSDESYKPYPWEKPYEPNLTGTPLAYRPDGSLLNKGERPRVSADYNAWSPE